MFVLYENFKYLWRKSKNPVLWRWYAYIYISNMKSIWLPPQGEGQHQWENVVRSSAHPWTEEFGGGWMTWKEESSQLGEWEGGKVCPAVLSLNLLLLFLRGQFASCPSIAALKFPALQLQDFLSRWLLSSDVIWSRYKAGCPLLPGWRHSSLGLYSSITMQRPPATSLNPSHPNIWFLPCPLPPPPVPFQGRWVRSLEIIRSSIWTFPCPIVILSHSCTIDQR